MLVFNGKTTEMIGNKLREEGDDMKQRFTANVMTTIAWLEPLGSIKHKESQTSKWHSKHMPKTLVVFDVVHFICLRRYIKSRK